jgi:hypothetical protein
MLVNNNNANNIIINNNNNNTPVGSRLCGHTLLVCWTQGKLMRNAIMYLYRACRQASNGISQGIDVGEQQQCHSLLGTGREKLLESSNSLEIYTVS